METLNIDVHKMIEELNQYMLPSTLMECFDAWREEAYKQDMSAGAKIGHRAPRERGFAAE